MKRILLAILLAGFTFPSFAQSMYSVYDGAGFITPYQSKITPRIGLEYLKGLPPHIYLGGGVSYESYSLLRYNHMYAQYSGPVYLIAHNSAYLFINPKIDIGIGHNEYIHAYASAGPGFIMHKEQTTSSMQPNINNVVNYPGLPYDTANTSANVNKCIFRYRFGVTEHVPILKGWDIIFSQEMGFSPSWISKNNYGDNGDSGMNFKTAYYSFTIGLMYKYRWEPVQARRTWGGY